MKSPRDVLSRFCATAKRLGILFLLSIVIVTATAESPTRQQPGVKRTDLQRHDLSVAGREVIQVRIDLDPGAVASRHTHPGEEIIYVLEGALEYQVEGKPPVTLKAGDVLFIPAGTIHAAKNVGSGNLRSWPLTSSKKESSSSCRSGERGRVRGLQLEMDQGKSGAEK